MPRQHPRVLPRPPWRSRLAGWLRGFAESLDPAPDGLDLTGAPDFWAEHVRAAARRARKNGREFRMRRWGVGERPGPAQVGAPHGDEPADARSRPEPVGSRATGEPNPPKGARTVGDPGLSGPSSTQANPETPAQPRAHAGEHPDTAGGSAGPLVRPRHPHPQRPSVQPPPSAPAGTRVEPAAPDHRTDRRDPPLVRPRNPAASRQPAVEPRPATLPRTVGGDSSLTWPALPPVPAPLPRANPQEWFSPREPTPTPATDDWPARRVPASREEPRTSRVRVGVPGEAREAPALAVPQHEPPQPDRAVLPESLWPELPARRPPVPVMPDPAPLLIRRERLAAEQAAT